MVKKLDIRLIQYINLFNSVTKVTPKDCFFEDSTLIFLVKEGDIGKAIGKGGMKIKLLKNKLRKEIKIIEFSEDILKFVKNLIYPNEVQKLYKEDSVVFIEDHNSRIKGKIYGRDRKNLKFINDILKKYFNSELKIK